MEGVFSPPHNKAILICKLILHKLQCQWWANNKEVGDVPADAGPCMHGSWNPYQIGCSLGLWMLTKRLEVIHRPHGKSQYTVSLTATVPGSKNCRIIVMTAQQRQSMHCLRLPYVAHSAPTPTITLALGGKGFVSDLLGVVPAFWRTRGACGPPMRASLHLRNASDCNHNCKPTIATETFLMCREAHRESTVPHILQETGKISGRPETKPFFPGTSMIMVTLALPLPFSADTYKVLSSP